MNKIICAEMTIHRQTKRLYNQFVKNILLENIDCQMDIDTEKVSN